MYQCLINVSPFSFFFLNHIWYMTQSQQHLSLVSLIHHFYWLNVPVHLFMFFIIIEYWQPSFFNWFNWIDWLCQWGPLFAKWMSKVLLQKLMFLCVIMLWILMLGVHMAVSTVMPVLWSVFTNHPEPWGEFLDVKHWPEISHPEKYAGKEFFFSMGSPLKKKDTDTPTPSVPTPSGSAPSHPAPSYVAPSYTTPSGTSPLYEEEMTEKTPMGLDSFENSNQCNTNSV